MPAYFNDAQIEATQDAGKIAGLNVLRIINEPTAASLAYGLEKESDQTILVFDLGGGTFDVSILELGEGVFEVKATNGDNHLGGDNFDKAIVDWMVAEFKRDQGIDLAAGPDGAPAALRGRREGEDRALLDDVDADQPAVHHGDAGGPEAPRPPAHAREARTSSPPTCSSASSARRSRRSPDAGLTPDQIDHVILVGGMTRMPAVQDKVKELIGKEPHKGVNPDEVVAVGAAIQAGVLKGEVKDVLLLDVTPLSLGIETKGGVFTKLIERNTTIPTKKSRRSRRPRTTSRRSRSTSSRASRRWRRSTRRSASSSSSASRRRRAACRRSRSPSTSTRTGSSTSPRRTSAPATSSRSASRAAPASTDEEVERMVREAEAHADEARKMREVAEARNQAETLVYSTEKSLKEHREALDEETISTIESRDRGAPRGARRLRRRRDPREDRAADGGRAQAGRGRLPAGAVRAGRTDRGGGQRRAPSDDEVVEEADYEVIDEEAKQS